MEKEIEEIRELRERIYMNKIPLSVHFYLEHTRVLLSALQEAEGEIERLKEKLQQANDRIANICENFLEAK